MTRENDHYKYLILGGGMVAGYAAGELAVRGLARGECAIISADDELPYERPPLSKGFLRGEESRDDIRIHDAAFYRDHGIDVRLCTRAIAIDTASHRVTLEGGASVRYDALVIATGAYPRKLPVPGAGRPGVYELRSLRDSAAIRDCASKAKAAAVVGGGFIGMEVTASLTSGGMPVTMIYREEHVGGRVFTPEIARFFEKYYADRGVRLLPNESVRSIDGTGDGADAGAGDGAVSGVTLASGAHVEAGMAVLGVGVVPAVELARAAGLRVDSGVIVDEYLRTSAPDVYAAGDVARYRDLLFGKYRRVEHWDNAVEQGKYVARMLTGDSAAFVHVPYFFSDVFDLSYEFWGDTDGAEAVFYRGDVTTPSFSAWWMRRNCVVAAMVMNRPDEEREIAPRWIAEREYVSEERLMHPTLANAV